METAGAEDMPEDAERKGLGTPATRAATLEKLVSAGLVQRKKKQLIPTEKGKNLIAVLPDNIKLFGTTVQENIYNGMWNYGAALSLIMLLLIGITILFTNEEDGASNESGGVI